MNKEERKKLLNGERPAVEVYINGKPFVITDEFPMGLVIFSPDMKFVIEFREPTEEEIKEVKEVEKTLDDPKVEETQIC